MAALKFPNCSLENTRWKSNRLVTAPFSKPSKLKNPI
jgi:hypothetical protein